MRKLFMLQGAPGCGKSTLIDSLGLSRNTLSYDHFRSLFGTLGHAFDGEVNSLTQPYELKAIEACQTAAESRMLAGDTLFIDNTNTKNRELTQWKARADKYGYEMFVVDMQGDLTDAQLLERNRNRPEFDRIQPDEIITRMAAAHRQHRKIAGIRYIRPDQIQRELGTRVFDANVYDAVVIVGDIQGCGDALRRLIDEVHSRDLGKTLWIFVGDYFDRGKNPGIVIEQINSLPHVVKVEGNHERSVRHTLTGVKPYRQSVETLELLHANGYTDKEILAFVNDTIPFFPFRWGMSERWVTHAGVDPAVLPAPYDGFYKMGLISNYSFMMGTGHRKEIYRGQSSYQKFLTPLDFMHDGTWVIQYFGHRNDEDEDPREYRNIRPLESKVEFGGYLTAILLDGDWQETLIRVEGEN